jgi:hypothetical protein
MAEQTRVEVYNSSGSLVFNAENCKTLDLSNLANGLYWIKTSKISSSIIIAH